MDATDLAWVVFTGGAVCDTSSAAVKVFEDHFFTLDDQLPDTACRVAISNKNFTQRRLFLSAGVNRAMSYQQNQS